VPTGDGRDGRRQLVEDVAHAGIPRLGVRHGRPLLGDHLVRVLPDQALDLLLRLRREGGALPVDAAQRAGLLADDRLGRVEALPGDDHHEAQQDGVDHADDGDDEPDHVVVVAHRQGRPPAPDPPLQEQDQAGHHDHQEHADQPGRQGEDVVGHGASRGRLTTARPCGPGGTGPRRAGRRECGGVGTLRPGPRGWVGAAGIDRRPLAREQATQRRCAGPHGCSCCRSVPAWVERSPCRPGMAKEPGGSATTHGSGRRRSGGTSGMAGAGAPTTRW
jgi:hypothetical protein